MRAASRGERQRLGRLLALCACAIAGACGDAQPGSMRAAPSPVDRAGLRARADALAERLEKIEARALREPELRRMNQALGAQLMDGMVAADPRLEEELARVPKLTARAAAARRGGDSAGLREARRELGAISRRFSRAREAALRDRQLAVRVSVFDHLLRERMLSIDPAAARLLARYQRVLEQIGEPGER